MALEPLQVLCGASGERTSDLGAKTNNTDTVHVSSYVADHGRDANRMTVSPLPESFAGEIITNR